MPTVLIVAAEAAPFAKTGGLGDVTGSLPKALRAAGVDAGVMLPRYASIAAAHREAMTLKQEITVPVGWRRQYCGLYELMYEDVPFYFLDNEYYFRRPDMYGFFDEAERYAFFCRAVLEVLPALPGMPRILHCHDWHTGMVAVMLAAHFRSRASYHDLRTVFTVHNLQYQGVFSKEIMGEILDLGWEYFKVEGIEFYDQVNFLKGGLVFADLITTVSGTYAAEIQTPFFGERLDGVIRNRQEVLYGIINGIDYESYDPEKDQRIFCTYNARQPGKRENKIKLQEMLGLSVNGNKPVVAIVARLVQQKGLDLIAHVLQEILALDLQLVVVGTGEARYEEMFRHEARNYPDKISVNICFDEVLARRVYAAADLLLMPSLYEPCGIAQLIAMRYGCLPVVRETGGLKDTVVPYNEYTDEGNGFSFSNYNGHDMLFTLKRALEVYRQPARWSRLVERAMCVDHSWSGSAQRYLQVYDVLSKKEAAHGIEQTEQKRAKGRIPGKAGQNVRETSRRNIRYRKISGLKSCGAGPDSPEMERKQRVLPAERTEASVLSVH